MPTRRTGYLPEDFAPIFDAAAPPPNFEPLGLHTGVETVLNRLSLQSCDRVKLLLHPYGGRFRAWYFLNYTVRSHADGSGFVLWVDEEGPHVAEFAFCKHKRELMPGANSARGYEPARCAFCQLDMTTESSG